MICFVCVPSLQCRINVLITFGSSFVYQEVREM
jgi:hypothetical protein